VPDFAAIDLSILYWVNSHARHSFELDKLVALLADATFFKGGFFFIYLWWLWFSQTGKRRDNRIEVLRICGGLVLALTLARALQILLPGRTRPIHDQSIGLVLPYGADPHILEHWNSFPSDHAVIYFAIATAIAMRWRLWGGLACLWALLVACLPRIYLGYHYPSDVLAGAGLGAVIMIAVFAAPLTSAGRWVADRVFRWETSHPALFYPLAFIVIYQFVTLFDTVRSAGRALAEMLSAVRRAASDGSGSEFVPLLGGVAVALILAVLAVICRRSLARRPRVAPAVTSPAITSPAVTSSPVTLPRVASPRVSAKRSAQPLDRRGGEIVPS
jgi:undecaprenyl-diphosphatase